ncbi:MAG: hypothetical protein ACE5EM_02505 [Sphingomonadales bacterium]
MKITPSTALISALSNLNENRINPNLQDALRQPPAPDSGSLETLKSKLRAPEIAPPVKVDPAARTESKVEVDPQFRREAVGVQQPAPRPGLGKVVDILV